MNDINIKNLFINGPIFNYNNPITDDIYDMTLVKGDNIKKPSYYMNLVPGMYTDYSLIDLSNQNTSIRLISYNDINNIVYKDNKPIPVEQCLVQTIVPISHNIDTATSTGIYNNYKASIPLIKQYIYSNSHVWVRIASEYDTWTKGTKLNNTNLDGTSFILTPQEQLQEDQVIKLKNILTSPVFLKTIDSAVSKLECSTVKKFMCQK
jgi:hypothetical protein